MRDSYDQPWGKLPGDDDSSGLPYRFGDDDAIIDGELWLPWVAEVVNRVPELDLYYCRSDLLNIQLTEQQQLDLNAGDALAEQIVRDTVTRDLPRNLKAMGCTLDEYGVRHPNGKYLMIGRKKGRCSARAEISWVSFGKLVR